MFKQCIYLDFDLILKSLSNLVNYLQESSVLPLRLKISLYILKHLQLLGNNV